MEDKEKKAVLRNYGNPDSPNYNDVYMHMGGDTYKNLRTLSIETIEPELASRVLKLNVNASFLINEFPLIEIFINKVGLKLSTE